MKRILWFEAFIMASYLIRASEYYRDPYYREFRSHQRFSHYPPPPTQFQRSHSGTSSESQFSQQQQSEWIRMRRRKPNLYQNEQPHYNSDMYKTPPRRRLYYDSQMYINPQTTNFQFPFPTSSRPSKRNKARRIQRRRMNQRNRSSKQRFMETEDNSQLEYRYDDYPTEKVETPPATTTTTTTTQAPFDINDIKVPTSFLRIEYMISFSFLGLMYGLGFLVMFQSLVVTTAKIVVTLVYYALLKAGVLRPYTIAEALHQMPPQK